MAVQGTIVTMGNLAATDAYLRISDIKTKKIVDSTSDDNGKCQMTYGVACYVSADERVRPRPRPWLRPQWIGSK